MRAFGRWMFGDIVSVVAPRVERGLPVTVDIDPDNDLIDAIYLEGHRFGTGNQSEAVVIMFLILVSGVFLLLRGIGRRRRSRLA